MSPWIVRWVVNFQLECCKMLDHFIGGFCFFGSMALWFVYTFLLMIMVCAHWWSARKYPVTEWMNERSAHHRGGEPAEITAARSQMADFSDDRNFRGFILCGDADTVHRLDSFCNLPSKSGGQRTLQIGLKRNGIQYKNVMDWGIDGSGYADNCERGM